jgi:hypothetical protein
MTYIFLDESGDLGFDFTKARTSKFFVITFLFSKDKKSLEKIVSKTHSELKKKYKQKGGVLHCHGEKEVTRKKLLKRLAEKEVAVMTVFLNKKKVYTKLQNEKTILYNYVTNILLDRIYSRKILSLDKNITLIASRKETNKFLNENFKNYISSQAKKNFQARVEVIIKTPHEEKALQAVDFVSWAIFRKHEYKDATYYNLIKNKIIEENPLYP